MAFIIAQLREDDTQDHLENGRSGVGALELRELGYVDALGIQEFSFKTHAGLFRHVPTRERLIYAPSAAEAGGRLIGIYPPAGMTAVNVQDSVSELWAAIGGGGGGGGTIGGAGTAGTLPYFASTNVLGDSILSQVGGELRFSGDTVANLYRPSAGILATDGDFASGGTMTAAALQALNGAEVNGLFVAYDGAEMGYDLEFNSASTDGAVGVLMLSRILKSNNNTREFSGLKILATLDAGMANENTKMNVLDIDTVNLAATGITTRLIKASYGGVRKMDLESSGNLIIMGGNVRFAAYSLGAPGDLNTEFVQLGVHSAAAYLQVGMSGSGEARPLQISLGNIVHHSLLPNGNVGFFNAADDHGEGVGVLRLHNAATIPSSNPASGFLMYAQGGAAKVRSSSGTVTTFGPAEPHCPACGSDFVKEFDSAKYGYLALCLRCLADEIGPKKWITRSK